MPSIILIASILISILAILFALYLTSKINKNSPGNEKMQEIAAAIEEGARAYLSRQ